MSQQNPTYEEYRNAVNVIQTYESQQREKESKAVYMVQKKLQEYFKRYLVAGNYIDEFTLQHTASFSYEIKVPAIIGIYDGQHDEKIEKIGSKHGLHIKFEDRMRPPVSLR